MSATAEATTYPADATEQNLHRVLRVSLMVLLIAVGCLALVSYSLTHWVEHQVLTTDNWVAVVAPLPQAPVVATALSSYITAQVFNNVPVEDEITSALPPKASFLAGPLATQLQALTTQIVHRVVTGDNFQNIWVAANRAAMDRLVSNARGQTQPLGARLEQKFSLDLSSVKSTLSSKLGTSAAALPDLSAKSGKVIAITTDLKAKRERVWSYIRGIDFLSAVTPFIVMTSFLGALVFSYHRRRTLLVTAAVVSVLFLIELIALKSVRQEVLDQVKVASNQPAVGYIYDAITSSFRQMLYAGLGISVAVVAICVLAGPARWAAAFRAQLRIDQLKNARPVTWWVALRTWMQQYQYYLWLGVGVVLLVWLAFAAQINTRVIINSVLVALSCIAAIAMLASRPHPSSGGQHGW